MNTKSKRLEARRLVWHLIQTALKQIPKWTPIFLPVVLLEHCPDVPYFFGRVKTEVLTELLLLFLEQSTQCLLDNIELAVHLSIMGI